jgi:PST family polysaccharide transporter
MMLPVYIVGGSLQSAFYPRMAKLRQDFPALRQVVLAATMAQAAFVFPPMAAVAASSEAFFKILFSDRWLSAGPLFTFLAAAGAIQTITALNASLLQAIGRTRARLRLTVEFAILWAISAFILGHFGVEAVALGCSVVTLLYLPRLLQLYVKPIGCTIVDFFRALLAPIIVAIVIFAAHRGITMQFEMDSWPEVGLAAIETVIGYGLLLWFGRRTLIERLETVRQIVAKEPISSEPAPASQPS